MTYTYKCKEHGTFDINCKMADVKETEQCPICKAESERFYADANPVVFKGHGWTRKMHR